MSSGEAEILEAMESRVLKDKPMTGKEKRRVKRAVFKSVNSAATSLDKKAAPAAPAVPNTFDVRTYTEAAGNPVISFQDLFTRPVPLVEHTNAGDAFLMTNYATSTLVIMRTAVQKLRAKRAAGDSSVYLEPDKVAKLKALREKWNDHLRRYKYSLWHAPPLSGGVTANYSLATQLWLLVAHANVMLQESGSVAGLADDDPTTSAYLTRNRLVLDLGKIMRYPLRTLLLTLDNFVARLDVIDRFHADYARFVVALEHRASRFICSLGDERDLNAADWCLPAPEAQQRRVAERFIMHTLVCFAKLYDYSTNWTMLGKSLLGTELIRVPAHIVRTQRWFPRPASMRGLSAFLCRYAKTMVDEVYISGIRDFLKQFHLRPVDMDNFRVEKQTNEAHITSVVSHKFYYRSEVAHAYLYHLHFQRRPYEYVAEWMQWNEGVVENTRSAYLGIQGFMAQMAVLFVWHTFVSSKDNLRFDFKRRCLLFQRDPAFSKSLMQARSMPYPVIVQQFARFSVLVPAAPGRQERVYDCLDIQNAIGVWCVWLMATSRDGAIERGTNFNTFLHEVMGQEQLDKSVRAITARAAEAIGKEHEMN
mgnify:CR=1 FL=1